MRRKSIIIVSILVVIVVIVIGIGLDIARACPVVAAAAAAEPVTVVERGLVGNVGLVMELPNDFVPGADLLVMPELEVARKNVLTLDGNYVLHSRVSRADSVTTC